MPLLLVEKPKLKFIAESVQEYPTPKYLIKNPRTGQKQKTLLKKKKKAIVYK